MISACTLFDSKFSIEGWLLWRSINKLNPFIKFYVLCMDERVYEEARFFQTKCGNIISIRLYDLENYFPKLLSARNTRPWAPYTQTCKVFLPTYIFENYKEEQIFYTDSDFYFWSDPEQIKLKSSFMVASREQEPPLIQGRFNGGFFACNRDSNKFLKWWQDKCIEWCLWKPENGKFGEEGYLNIFYDEPERFDVEISNPGINLANWNIDKHKLKIDNGIIIDECWKLICFHYQGMKINKKRYDPCIMIRSKEAKYIYDFYYEKYLSFKEELDELDCFWWR